MSSIISKGLRLIYTYSDMFCLRLQNYFSRRSILGGEDVVVTLTSHGKRISRSFYSIESIARGVDRPSQIILYLDDIELVKRPSKELNRLVQRGLSIRQSSNFGPHTKYFPYVQSQPIHKTPLVTSDDDVIYGRAWLAELVGDHQLFPGYVIAQRAHLIETTPEGRPLPYRQWSSCDGDVITSRNFATGVSGVLYPAEFLQVLARHGDAFLSVSPRADDVWLHAMAVRSNTLVKQIHKEPQHYPTIRGTQDINLWKQNVFDGGNDSQILATYSDDILEIIARG